MLLRRMKFRGKDVKTDEWVYGQLIIEEVDDEAIHTYILSNPHLDFIESDYMRWSCIDADDIIKVKPDTVGQFTGFYDKDWNEIYEGDIIRNIKTGETGFIKFETGCFKFVPFEKETAKRTPLYKLLTSEFEVVANIYENVEILRRLV